MDASASPADAEASSSADARANGRRNPLRALGRLGARAFRAFRALPRKTTSRRRRRQQPPFACISASMMPEEIIDSYVDDSPGTRNLLPQERLQLPSQGFPVVFVQSTHSLDRFISASQNSPITSSQQQEHHQHAWKTPEGASLPQRLLVIGSRHWGSNSWWDTRSLLKVKIYDFAVYCNSHAVQAFVPALLSGLKSARSQHQTLDPLSLVVRSTGPRPPVDASIVIRAARDLPVEQLSMEMEKVLTRRHIKAGGSADDPALQQLLSYFSTSALPASALSPAGGHVRRGAAISFTRTCTSSSDAEEGCGTHACELVTVADGKLLGRVRSNSLSEALFDLYLGEQPVSNKAKDAAVDSLYHMATNPLATYKPAGQEKLVCSGAAEGGLEACEVHVP
mmetsp:Transcript_16861/g.36496  ORF Transcript_16861/g.36496 Transcript_16861/m.36496 type:complete len:395 (+) Transcript_16861:146-1330(+)|eukprot:CAMPEP_0202895036 /NCGR_PEP_ID=MMETSP1392-20130828/4312_1 /ASSEMBLY_ACC=CAM_ASM_000868 /TAXON_ID=225041 /ORGANISM="Chlamydomonas chlamydogama, Strain SAG 11-48b" /LENGTH=394 /DNA_ID=CAMNT_0049579911 /DNA_START=126 /DNA_END=1310 /DNA_ORIENTATION=-